MNEILENLRKLIGEEFNEDDIICCFQDVENEIIVNKSNNNGYDYVAYENEEDAAMYLIKINEKNEISEVWES